MDNEKEVTQQTTEKEDKKLSLKDLMSKKKAEMRFQQ